MNRTGHRGRVDGNQAQIVKEMRECAIDARSTAQIGDGFPDIAAGFRGICVLIEVKQPGEKLTKAEEAFRDTWSGPYAIATNSAEAVSAVLEHAKKCGKL